MSRSAGPLPSAPLATAVATGQTERHLADRAPAESPAARLHRDVLDAFDGLRQAAAGAGFDLRVLSGFRSFERQLAIWNDKVEGRRPVLDGDALPLDIARLSERDLMFAILRWSALPGASRHHWGTDLDVFDGAARPAGYEVELIPAEVDPGGMFAPLHEWLDERIAAGKAFGFFRPYDRDRNGVAPERWHLSHGPTAAEYERLVTPALLRDTLQPVTLALKGVVMEHLRDIVDRFVRNVSRGAG